MKGEISLFLLAFFFKYIRGHSLSDCVCVCVCVFVFVYRLGPWRHYGEMDEAHSHFPSSLFELAPPAS